MSSPLLLSPIVLMKIEQEWEARRYCILLIFLNFACCEGRERGGKEGGGRGGRRGGEGGRRERGKKRRRRRERRRGRREGEEGEGGREEVGGREGVVGTSFYPSCETSIFHYVQGSTEHLVLSSPLNSNSKCIRLQYVITMDAWISTLQLLGPR